jgi:thiamine pyrophosphate-dependent acetolactate synthase large subunit-like protein
VIQRLAQRIGAIIVPTLHAKGVLGDDEYYAGIAGLFSTRTLMQLAEEADCVIAFGTSMNNYAVQVRGKSLFPNARVVHVDIAPHLMTGTGAAAECYIQGDALTTAAELDDRLAAKGVAKEGFRTSAVRRALLDAARDPTECEIDPGTVDPRDAARTLDERLPSNVGLVVGDGHFMSFPIMLMKKRRDVHVFSTAFGSIGQGLATGIGAAVATRGPILCVEGDGGALQNIQELDTAHRLGLKLLYVVMNDQAYAAEYHKLKVKKLDAALAAVPSPDFGAVARGFGCRGCIARNVEEIAAAVETFMTGEGPMVVDVRVSRNVISIPYRRMHLGQDV